MKLSDLRRLLHQFANFDGDTEVKIDLIRLVDSGEPVPLIAEIDTIWEGDGDLHISAKQESPE